INHLPADARAFTETVFQRLSQSVDFNASRRYPLGSPRMAPIDFIVRLLLAAALGAALGLEREMRRQPAGLRADMVIRLGSALFSLVSIQLARDGGAADRVAANIVTGVGFL